MQNSIREAAPEDIARLAVLFDAYRVFYDQLPDVDGARRFVERCLLGRFTRFFVASFEGELVGFVHLLPVVDTIAMCPAWLLEDLYVDPAFRGRGVGAALVRHAETFARSTGANRISLSTAHANLAAQRLYEASGYALDTTFRTYHRKID